MNKISRFKWNWGEKNRRRYMYMIKTHVQHKLHQCRTQKYIYCHVLHRQITNDIHTARKKIVSFMNGLVTTYLLVRFINLSKTWAHSCLSISFHCICSKISTALWLLLTFKLASMVQTAESETLLEVCACRNDFDSSWVHYFQDFIWMGMF